MKKILLIHSSAELYGSDKSLLNIVKHLDKSKYEIHVVLPCDGPLVAKLKQISGVHITIFNIAVLRRKNLSPKGLIEYMRDFRAAYKYLVRYIKKHQIDIVETNTSVVLPGAVAAKRLHRKSIWHIREIITNGMENKVISMMMMNRYADVIVANSVATAKALKVDQKKVVVVYNAVEQPKNWRRKTAGQTRTFTVGMAGRINRWKGQKVFVEAAKIVLEKDREVEFVMAGEAYKGEAFLKAELEELIAEAKIADKVRLLGQVDKMDDFYRQIDVLVVPSVKPEPFGLVVIEGMMRGVPVIATKHGGPVEIISERKNGLLVEPGNAEAIAEAILLLKHDSQLYATIVENGLLAREQYSVEKLAQQMEKIYEQICEKKEKK